MSAHLGDPVTELEDQVVCIARPGRGPGAALARAFHRTVPEVVRLPLLP